MRYVATATLFPLLYLLLSGWSPAQTAPATSSAVMPASSAVATVAAPSAVLRAPLTSLERVLGTLDVEKWKLPRQARDDARRNVDSIRQDMTATLPPLMTAADAAPGSVPAELAMLRNVDALYDVALRLSATATVAAPTAQAASLDQALGELLQGRRSLGDHVMADATAQDHVVGELQGKLRAGATPPVCPAAIPTATETKSKAKRARPRVKAAPAAAPQ